MIDQSSNKIAKGYKQTEVGVIPMDWLVKQLGEIGEFNKGKGIKKDSVLSEGLPCIRYGELYTHHHEYIRYFNSFINKETAKKSKLIKYGDILFAGSGETKEEIGKCCAFIDRKDAYAGGDVIILSPDNIYDSLFLGFLLNHEVILKQKAQKAQGDAVVHIYPSSLSEIFTPLPPTLTEQKAIATVLSDNDALIDSLDKLISKKKMIKKGTMQQLLTGKKRLPGFSGEWGVKTINDLTNKVIDNRGKTPLLSKEGHCLIEVNAIYNQLKYPNYKFVAKYVNDETYLNWFREGHPDAGAILITTVGSAGETVIMKEKKGCIAQNIIALELTEDCCNDFFYYYTKTAYFKNQVRAVLMGAVQPSLKVPYVLNFKIKIPKDIKEQQNIANILNDMDTEIEALEQKRDKYKAIKQGMMQELLTGKTRLV